MPEISLPSTVEVFRDFRLGEDLLWREVRIPRFPQPTPALFLDRDGVIVEEKLYLSNPRDVRMLPGVVELIRVARSFEMPVVEVTNQAGIARGYFSWSDFVKVENEVTEKLGKEGAALDAIFACPFHPQGQPPYERSDHPWRKPNPGMLIEAAGLMNLDLGRSVVVGDNAQDLQAARSAGVALGIHVLTGHGRTYATRSRALANQDFIVCVVTDATEAASLLAKQQRVA